MSELLSGVTQLKIRDICLLQASGASETVLGVDNAKSGICYIYMYICMYAFKRVRGCWVFSIKTRLFMLDPTFF